MVEKVKSLNWPLYSNIGLALLNISVFFCVISLAFNTKNLNSHQTFYSFACMGLLVFILLKLNNAADNNRIN